LKEPFRNYVKEKLGSNFLLIACGLPASWKTETTEEVSKIKNCAMLRSDIIRLDVLKNEDIFDNKVASNMNKRTRVYDEVFRQADEALNYCKSIILDATFITQELRKRAAAIAGKHHLPFIILQTNCPQEVSLKRISKRTKEKYESNAITEEAYLNNKNKFENVDLDDIKKSYPDVNIIHIIVDTKYDKPEQWYIIGEENR
jgi:predicted kinase